MKKLIFVALVFVGCTKTINDEPMRGEKNCYECFIDYIAYGRGLGRYEIVCDKTEYEINRFIIDNTINTDTIQQIVNCHKIYIN